MKILLHSCCAPCANQCVEVLRQAGHVPVLFWYNPNIHPYTEYKARREGLRVYAGLAGVPLVEAGEYGLRPFLSATMADVEGRCGVCYGLRMEETARFAAENGYDGFTTSLLISPYQKHEQICEAAMAAAERHGGHFAYYDFRPYFRAGQQTARDMGIYMQKYCGCIFSEEERYVKKKR